MNTESLFADLGDQQWSQFGEQSLKVPELLRNLASSDPDVSQEAFIGLCDSSVMNQGSVSPVTAQAVPYLARLAADAVPATPDVLFLLGAIAEADDDGAARAAVADELSRLLPLLSHQDAHIRQLAVWVTAQCRMPKMVFDHLLARWGAERDPAIRADLLLACVLLDPAKTAPLAAAGLTDGSDRVRIAALIAGLDAGLPWTNESASIMLSLLPASERIGQTPWSVAPIAEVTERLQRRGALDAAVDLLLAAMSMESAWNSAAREEAELAARLLGDREPRARVALLPGFLRLLDDPSQKRHVMRVISGWRTPGVDIIATLEVLATATDKQIAGNASKVLAGLVDRPWQRLDRVPSRRGGAVAGPGESPFAPASCC